jgi:hypothetical protein
VDAGSIRSGAISKNALIPPLFVSSRSSPAKTVSWGVVLIGKVNVVPLIVSDALMASLVEKLPPLKATCEGLSDVADERRRLRYESELLLKAADNRCDGFTHDHSVGGAKFYSQHFPI